MTIHWDELIKRAEAAQINAHAPYSQYRVGAAVLTASGAIFAGCNIENASYGLAICAERCAIAQMVAAGERDPIAVVVLTRGPEAAAPCGMCRQTLVEFAADLPVLLVTNHDPAARELTTLAELLPRAFRAKSLST